MTKEDRKFKPAEAIIIDDYLTFRLQKIGVPDYGYVPNHLPDIKEQELDIPSSLDIACNNN